MMAAVVAAMTLGELLGPAAGSLGDIEVTDLVSDSRKVKPGAAFVAVQGARSHGLDYADRALAAGASVVLYAPDERRPAPSGPVLAVPGLQAGLGDYARRFFGRPVAPDRLIGVTGTNGKTTVAWLVAQGLSALGEPCGYLGTIGYGTPGNLRRQSLTTPDCLSLHRALAEIGLEPVALEVSSHALSQDRVAGLGFEAAIFTNLSHDHLDWHGTMDAYFDAKASLFERPELKSAIVNIDDDFGRKLLGRLANKTERLTTSVADAAGADLMARTENRGLAGIALEIDGRFGRARLDTRLIGQFNAENLLLAAGALLARGFGLEAVARALGTAAPAPGRMETFGGGAEPLVVVDYAHTPAALRRVLETLAAIGPVTCVFGCGGERDRDKRAPMGEAAATLARQVVLTDDNPRGEDPAAILAAIRAGMPATTAVRIEHERGTAIREAIASATAGDIVLIAGKGHETRQIIGDSFRELDDRALVRNILGSES